jgi:hypothetical protein
MNSIYCTDELTSADELYEMELDAFIEDNEHIYLTEWFEHCQQQSALHGISWFNEEHAFRSFMEDKRDEYFNKGNSNEQV